MWFQTQQIGYLYFPNSPIVWITHEPLGYSQDDDYQKAF